MKKELRSKIKKVLGDATKVSVGLSIGVVIGIVSIASRLNVETVEDTFKNLVEQGFDKDVVTEIFKAMGMMD